MNIFKRILEGLGISPPKQKNEISALKDILELGRQARYAENYSNALDLFNKAVEQAEQKGESTALVIARLNIADTYIHMEQYDEAENLLIDLENDTEKRHHFTPLSYTLSLMGYLHQVQENWDLARSYYNRAITIAEKAHADGALGRAKGHLADTYLREGNATYAEHLLREALPLLDKTDDIELTSHFIGQYALTMLQLGRTTDGERLLETALNRAKRINYQAQIRHWTLKLAEYKLSQNDYQTAFQHYDNFLKLSPDPMPQTEIYGFVLSNLSEISRHLGHHQESLAYAQQAEKILSQLESIKLSAQALLTMGLAMRANHHYDEAIQYFEQAQQTADADLMETIRLEIAQTFVISGDLKQAESHYQDLIEQSDDDAPIRGQMHAGLGNVYRQQNDYEQAIKQWMNAVKRYESISDHNHTARIMCDIAEARYELGDGKRALADYERALMLLNSVDRETRGIVMANVAIAYADKGDAPSTEAFFSESIEIAHELQNPSAEAIRRNNYAMFLIDIGQAQRAIVSIEHAQKLLEQQNSPLHRAIFADNMGRAFRALGKVDKALPNHLLAEQRFRELPASDWQILNKLHFIETYLDLHQIDEAKPYISEDKGIHLDTIIQYHLTLARFAMERDEMDNAKQHITEAITLARSSYRQHLLAKSLVLQSQIQMKSNQRDDAVGTWNDAEKLLKLLQMSVPSPNWLHVPSEETDS